MSKIKKGRLDQYGAECFGRLIFATIRKSVGLKGLNWVFCCEIFFICDHFKTCVCFSNVNKEALLCCDVIYIWYPSCSYCCCCCYCTDSFSSTLLKSSKYFVQFNAKYLLYTVVKVNRSLLKNNHIKLVSTIRLVFRDAPIMANIRYRPFIGRFAVNRNRPISMLVSADCRLHSW